VPPRRTIEGHPDFAVLEARLAELVREARSADGPLTPLAIIAPTRRLLAHLQGNLAGRFPALLNVRFFHHESLIEAAGVPAAAAVPLLIAGPAVNLPSLLTIARTSSWKVAATVAVTILLLAIAGGLLASLF